MWRARGPQSRLRCISRRCEGRRNGSTAAARLSSQAQPRQYAAVAVALRFFVGRAPDDQSFYIVREASTDRNASEVILVQHWFQALEARVRARR